MYCTVLLISKIKVIGKQHFAAALAALCRCTTIFTNVSFSFFFISFDTTVERCFRNLFFESVNGKHRCAVVPRCLFIMLFLIFFYVGILKYVRNHINACHVQLKLCKKLNIFSFTRELTFRCGNLWVSSVFPLHWQHYVAAPHILLMSFFFVFLVWCDATA